MVPGMVAHVDTVPEALVSVIVNWLSGVPKPLVDSESPVTSILVWVFLANLLNGFIPDCPDESKYEELLGAVNPALIVTVTDPEMNPPLVVGTNAVRTLLEP